MGGGDHPSPPIGGLMKIIFDDGISRIILSTDYDYSIDLGIINSRDIGVTVGFKAPFHSIVNFFDDQQPKEYLSRISVNTTAIPYKFSLLLAWICYVENCDAGVVSRRPAFVFRQDIYSTPLWTNNNWLIGATNHDVRHSFETCFYKWMKER